MTAPEKDQQVGWSAMIIIALGLSLVIMDSTIVNVALPSIISDLSISSVDAEWVQAIYALVFAALLIIVGRLGDRFGRRAVFTAGAAVFAVASVLAALSGSGETLIAARALQGVGGAMMSPTSLALINALFRGARRAIAFAIYGSVIGGMAAIGPLLGGYLTEHFSWRWASGINLPFAAAIVIGAFLLVPESKDEHAEAGFDGLGAVLSAVGIGAFVFALIEGRSYGWTTAIADGSLLGIGWTTGGLSPIPVALAVSVVGLVGLAVVETRRRAAGRSVLIDTSLFRIRSFGLGALAAMILSLGEFGVLFSLPLFLQGALGYSALGAGGVLAALAAGSFLSGPTTPVLARRYGPRFVARLGMAVEMLAIASLGLVISVDVPAVVLVACLVVYGVGVGFASAQLTSVILADVPVRQSGQASGTQSTARQVGSALGTAVLGTILFVGLAHDTETRVAEIPGVSAEQAAEVAQVVQGSAGTAIPSLAAEENGAALVEASSQAFADALQRTAFTGAGFVALGLVATLLLPADRRPEQDEDPAGPAEQSAGAAPDPDPGTRH